MTRKTALNKCHRIETASNAATTANFSCTKNYPYHPSEHKIAFSSSYCRPLVLFFFSLPIPPPLHVHVYVYAVSSAASLIFIRVLLHDDTWSAQPPSRWSRGGGMDSADARKDRIDTSAYSRYFNWDVLSLSETKSSNVGKIRTDRVAWPVKEYFLFVKVAPCIKNFGTLSKLCILPQIRLVMCF